MFMFPVPNPDDLQALREREARGEASICTACGWYEGLQEFGGQCVTCYINESHKDMPADSSRDELERDMRQAFGLSRVDTMPVLEFLSRDASVWDQRMYRGWSGFRIQILAVSRLSPLALPVGWTLRVGALPPDAQVTRLRLEPTQTGGESTVWQPEDHQGQQPLNERRDERVVVFRVRLWRLGSSGYLQALWVGDAQRLEWSLHDLGEIRPADLRKIWLPAAQEERRRGRPGGPPETREELIAAIHAAYARTKDAGVRLEGRPRIEWRANLANYIQLLSWETGMPDSTLRDHLRYFNLTLSEIFPELNRRARR